MYPNELWPSDLCLSDHQFSWWLLDGCTEQNGRHYTDDFFKCIFMNEKFCSLIPISLNFVHKGPIDKKSVLCQVMAWHQTSSKPLSEPMLTEFNDVYMRDMGRWLYSLAPRFDWLTILELTSVLMTKISPTKLPSNEFQQILLMIHQHWFRYWLRCQVTNHYLNQCWSSSMSLYGIIRPQWVKFPNFNSTVIGSLGKAK